MTNVTLVECGLCGVKLTNKAIEEHIGICADLTKIIASEVATLMLAKKAR